MKTTLTTTPMMAPADG